MTAKQYIICDGDQTLYENVITPINDGMLETIQTLIRSGAGFGVISGTDIAEISRLIRSKEINQEHHILATSGASYFIHDGKNTRNVYEVELSNQDKGAISNALEMLIGKYNIIPLTSRKDQIQDRISQITFSALGRNAPIELKDAYDKDKSKRKEFRRFLRKYLPEDKFNITIGGTTSMDITDSKVDKGYGIERFVQHNRLTFDDIIFYGDKLEEGGNDHSVRRNGIRCIRVNGVEDTMEKLNYWLMTLECRV